MSAVPGVAVADEVVPPFVLQGNLDSRSADRALFELSIVLHDDLGFRHDLTLRFVKQDIINAWDWSVWTSDAAIPLPNPIAFGVLLFDQVGRPILPPDFVPGLNVLFAHGAPPFMAERAVPVILDRVTGHPGNTTLRVLPRAIPPEPTRTPTRTPVASPTATTTRVSGTSTRTPTPANVSSTVTPVISATATPRATATPTRTPQRAAPRYEWLTGAIDITVDDGQPVAIPAVIRVTQPVARAQVVSQHRGGTVEVEGLPQALEADVPYPMLLRFTVGASGQRLVGSLRLRNGSASVAGSTLRFVVAHAAKPPTPTRTSVVATRRPTATAVSGRARSQIPRIAFHPSSVRAMLRPGEGSRIEVSIDTSMEVDNPELVVFSRIDGVEPDLASLPARLVPTNPQTVFIDLSMPDTSRGRSESAIVAIRAGGRILNQRLLIRMVPRLQ